MIVLDSSAVAPQRALGAELSAPETTAPEAIPRVPDAAILRWVGQYGSEHSVFTIYEDQGELYA